LGQAGQGQIWEGQIEQEGGVTIFSRFHFAHSRLVCHNKLDYLGHDYHLDHHQTSDYGSTNHDQSINHDGSG
jgi:hypothetical protein